MDPVPVLCVMDDTSETPPRTESWRVAVVRVGYRDVLDCVMTGMSRLPQYVKVLKGPGLPTDARVLSVRENFMTRCFEFMVEHPSFDEVPEGMSAPLLGGVFGFEWEVVPTTQENNRG